MLGERTFHSARNIPKYIPESKIFLNQKYILTGSDKKQ